MKNIWNKYVWWRIIRETKNIESWLIIKHPGTFKILRVLILKNGTVYPGCLCMDLSNGNKEYELYPSPNSNNLNISISKCSNNIKERFAKTSETHNGEKIIEVNNFHGKDNRS